MGFLVVNGETNVQNSLENKFAPAQSPRTLQDSGSATLMRRIQTGRAIDGVMSHQQRDLTRKANQILAVYGGLEGLARKPAWIISEVLRAFFTDEERREIIKLRTFRGLQKEILQRLQSKAAA